MNSWLVFVCRFSSVCIHCLILDQAHAHSFPFYHPYSYATATTSLMVSQLTSTPKLSGQSSPTLDCRITFLGVRLTSWCTHLVGPTRGFSAYLKKLTMAVPMLSKMPWASCSPSQRTQNVWFVRPFAPGTTRTWVQMQHPYMGQYFKCIHSIIRF